MSSQIEDEVKPKKNPSLLTLLQDFFDYIVWDSLSLIVIEASGLMKSNIAQIKDELREKFISSLKSDEQILEFKNSITNTCKKCSVVNELKANYIAETLSIYRERMFNVYTKKELESDKIDSIQAKDLKNLVDKYVIVLYLDRIIFSNLIRILLYSSDVSYGEINEFRLHIIDTFRESLNDRITVKELTDYVKTSIYNLNLPNHISELVSSNLFAYLSMILRSPDLDKMIEHMKDQLRKITVLRSDLSFLEMNKIDLIVKWVHTEVIEPFIEILTSIKVKVSPSFETIIPQIFEIFKKLLSRTLTIDSIINRLESIKEDTEFKILEKKNKNKNYIKDILTKEENIYSGENFYAQATKKENEEEISDSINLNDPEEAWELFFKVLENLALILADEMIEDYKLDNLLNLINKGDFDFDSLYL